MAGIGRVDARRRAFLTRALALGWLAGGSGWNRAAIAQAGGRLPRRLPEGSSIFELAGEVLVNGKRATRDTRLTATDTIRTGPGARIVGVVGQDAFILRQKSELRMGRTPGTAVRQFFRLVTGAMLSVFGERRGDQDLLLRAPTATIGIRGTGVYLEAEPDRTYVCTCYGLTQIAAEADPSATALISSVHHDAAQWVLAKPDGGRLIVPAPFQNHDDLELMTIEALVGRDVPFTVPTDLYDRPRREY